MQPNIPVDLKNAILKMQETVNALGSALSLGESTIYQSSRGAFEPFRTYQISMLLNNTVYTPFKIGPHKSILYRGIQSVSSSGVITPLAYSSNDVAYYLAGRKDADSSRWMALQAGKSIEFDFPVDEGWIFIPNPDRNPTFGIFETSVIGYIRSYAQAGIGDATQLTDGSTIDPRAAVSVGTTCVEVVPVSAVIRTATLYNAGPNKAWIGGQFVDGMGGGPYEAAVDAGVPILVGEKLQIRNISGITAICDTGESAEISYTMEF